jgi:hypothetical protein
VILRWPEFFDDYKNALDAYWAALLVDPDLQRKAERRRAEAAHGHEDRNPWPQLSGSVPGHIRQRRKRIRGTRAWIWFLSRLLRCGVFHN